MTVTREDIATAAARIAPHVRVTPMLTTAPGDVGVPLGLSLKLEFLQHAGSFKPRGAFNSLLSAKVPPVGVAAASGGNHAAA
jgi:threonine dehydratase